MPLNENDIQLIIQRDCVLKGHKYVCPKVTNFFYGEADVLSVSSRGYAYEYEVKISRSDFFADKKKVRKHDIYSNPHDEWSKNNCPNYFVYAVPEGLISIDEVPEYAGLIYIKDEAVEIVKAAPFLHKSKPDLQKLMHKMLMLYQQRAALGCTLLTHLNREIKIANEKAEKARKEQTQKFIDHYKKLKV